MQELLLTNGTVIAIGFGIILAILHWFSNKISPIFLKKHLPIKSFSAGLLITMIILTILPEIYLGQNIIGEQIFTLMLLGFIGIHIVEKYFYQHITNKNKLIQELAELHTIGFFLNHFILGMLLFITTTINKIEIGIIIFIPFLLHTITSSLSLTHLDEYYENKKISLLLAISPLLGVITTALLNLELTNIYLIFGFGTGVLMYVGIRDMIPQGKKENSIAFILGVIVYILILIIMKATK